MHRYYDYTGFFIRFLTSANGAIGAGTSAITCTMFGFFFLGGGGRERAGGLWSNYKIIGGFLGL